MIVWNAVFMTFKQIRRNPMRSALTTLGVLIGVAAVIAMVALGRGAAASVQQDLSGLGQNLLFVMPGTPGHSGGPGSWATARPFSIEDARAVEDRVPGVAAVAPMSMRSRVAVYGSANWRTAVTGSDNKYFRVLSWQLARGRLFDETELRAGAPVAVLGHTVVQELFGALDPIHATVRVGNVSLRVIGTLRPKGQSTFGQDQDDFIIVPLATHQRRFTGDRDLEMLFISAAPGADTGQIKRDVEALMRERRRIAPGDAPDFFVRDMKEVAATVSNVTGVVTSLLAAIAAVSLMVGGIGIMNIMLVAVSERTREIGIRMAVGARSRDVLTQFLVESVTLSVLGGVAGIGLGLAGSYAATERLGVPLIVDATLLAVPFGFAVVVGVMFGFFPARKAARMNPIDALRYE